jgi:hypothetical protein
MILVAIGIYVELSVANLRIYKGLRCPSSGTLIWTSSDLPVEVPQKSKVY